MAETDLWFGTLSATVRVEDLPASRRVVAIELPADGQWRVCGAGASNAEGVATLPITGLPTSRIYAVAIDDWGRPFVPGMTVAFGDVIRPTQFIGWMYQVTSPGVLPGEEPEWWNSMAGIPQPVGTAMMQAIRHYQPIAHGPVSDIEWEEREFDPHWDKVVTLLRFDGDLIDETGFAWGQLVSPTFEAGMFSQSLRGHASQATLEGGNNTIADNQSTPFTVEAFVKIRSTSVPIVSQSRRASAGDQSLYISANHIRWQDLPASSSTIAYVDTPTDSWVHVAFTYDGTTRRAFINGNAVFEEIKHGWRPNQYGVRVLGAHNGSYGEHGSDGSLDELRITKGIARYTENFTPPTAPFPNVGPPL